MEAAAHALQRRFLFFRRRARAPAHEGEASNHAEETHGVDEIRGTDTKRANDDTAEEGTCQGSDLPPGYIQSISRGQLLARNQQRDQCRSCWSIKNTNRSG